MWNLILPSYASSIVSLSLLTALILVSRVSDLCETWVEGELKRVYSWWCGFAHALEEKGKREEKESSKQKKHQEP